MKIFPADVKRMINFLEETHYKNKCSILSGRQIMHQIFSFFNLKNLNDLLDVELYSDNFKMFSQAWEVTQIVLGSDLDECVLKTCTRGK